MMQLNKNFMATCAAVLLLAANALGQVKDLVDGVVKDQAKAQVKDAVSFEQLVPEDAWLEGIVNAVVHRSYSVQGDHIHVDIYDDRIVIESPGRFPGLVDTSNPLEITRFARNPRIARVCTDLRITQELGEGIRRIFDEMRQAGLSDPRYHQTSGSVQLTLSGEPVERRITEQLPALQQRILTALREVDSMSTGEIADAVSVARPTALRHLGELRNAGYIEWVGKSTRDPRASWRIPH